jgi:phenylalanyl-tRNA synthetase alpha chain
MSAESWRGDFERLLGEPLLKNLPEDAESLESRRVEILGRDGRLTKLLKELKELSLEERREFGPKIQALKADFEARLAARKAELEDKADQNVVAGSGMDPTLPAFRNFRGRIHPLIQVLAEIERCFALVGFSTAEGPLVETDRYNFTALNIPEHHPARDMHDTLYLKGSPLLMRTHTSPVQIRVLEKQKPPIRIICPGRVFRHEAVDATHSSVFHQVEGLCVDRGVSFADLKGTLDAFLKSLFGPKTKTLFRPTYFPFTEPSADVYASCLFCAQKGCSVCKHTGFIELLGAGVVHPNVLSGVGLDPEVWSGFAFGIGVERVAMLKYGIADIRSFYENDVRFLGQFDESLV